MHLATQSELSAERAAQQARLAAIEQEINDLQAQLTRRIREGASGDKTIESGIVNATARKVSTEAVLAEIEGELAQRVEYDRREACRQQQLVVLTAQRAALEGRIRLAEALTALLAQMDAVHSQERALAAAQTKLFQMDPAATCFIRLSAWHMPFFDRLLPTEILREFTNIGWRQQREAQDARRAAELPLLEEEILRLSALDGEYLTSPQQAAGSGKIGLLTTLRYNHGAPVRETREVAPGAESGEEAA